jgi:hypothetical protein
MSIYLPYCDKFVTTDEEQRKCLREIAHLATVETEIMSYDDFVPISSLVMLLVEDG